MQLTTPQAANILIVDDNLNNLKVLVGILSDSPYKIRRAVTGDIALQCITASPPDLIMLDIILPDFSGYEICSKLKQDPETANIPIIFMSALSSNADKVKAFTVGGADYITKPFESTEVKARIRNQLQLRAAQAQVKLLTAELEKMRTVQISQSVNN